MTDDYKNRIEQAITQIEDAITATRAGHSLDLVEMEVTVGRLASDISKAPIETGHALQELVGTMINRLDTLEFEIRELQARNS
jgi:hypothetical protein